jgi:hypothetical protein
MAKKPANQVTQELADMSAEEGTNKIFASRAPDEELIQALLKAGLGQLSTMQTDAATLEKMGFTRRERVKLQPGDQIAGVYLGSGGTFIGPDENNPGEDITYQLHKFRLSETVEVDLIGVYKLNTELGNTAPNTFCVIQHLGKVDIKEGKKRMNEFAIYRMDSAKAKVA